MTPLVLIGLLSNVLLLSLSFFFYPVDVPSYCLGVFFVLLKHLFFFLAALSPSPTAASYPV
jgi:hypothetical protein